VTLVVDASVATKWVLDEEGSAPANALRNEPGLIAPSLIAAEVGNALWKAVRHRSVPKSDALAAMDAVFVPFDHLVSDEDLRGRALEIAIEVSLPIYDCFYIALAQQENAPLITADERQLAAARKAKVKVRRL
jgi:predicted nucleic acid-binding protein